MRRELRQRFADQEAVGAEEHPPALLEQPVHDVHDVRMEERLAARYRDDGGLGSLGRSKALLHAQALSGAGRVLPNTAASNAVQVAVLERFEHEHHREQAPALRPTATRHKVPSKIPRQSPRSSHPDSLSAAADQEARRAPACRGSHETYCEVGADHIRGAAQGQGGLWRKTSVGPRPRVKPSDVAHRPRDGLELRIETPLANLQFAALGPAGFAYSTEGRRTATLGAQGMEKGGGGTMAVLWSVTAAALLAWAYLALGRGLFWHVAPRLEPGDGSRGDAFAGGPAPAVAAVIPARNEEDVLPTTLPTVLRQSYGGPFRVTLVDDRSEDATAQVARDAAAAVGEETCLAVLNGTPLPEGWSGKVWALAQGTAAERAGQRPEYFWFTDADIAHEPWVLASLVERAERDRLDLVSVMAVLRVDTGSDRLLIPAFVYFFAKLYPFRWVSDPLRRNAGAAGGCVLVRRSALEKAGGLTAMRSALIDDCRLGRLIKRSGGRIWLGYSSGVQSVRRYGTVASVWDMVARSAYDQLGYSPLLLTGTILGMLFLYALGPVICLAGAVAAALGTRGALPLSFLGAAAWALPSATFIPILRHHGVPGWRSLFLPAAGALYAAMTLSSAYRHATGRGGAWKGRVHGE